MQIEEAIKIIKKDLCHLFGFDENGKYISSPEREIPTKPIPKPSPYNFLEYAIQDLDSEKETHDYVKCLSNCRRAIDSQVEVLIMKLGYKKVANQKQWSIPTKFEFIGEFDIISTRILNRIKMLRNKLEHESIAPESSDVEDALNVTALFLLYSANVKIPSLNINFSHGLGARYDYENMTFTFFKDGGSGKDHKDLGINLKYGDQYFNDFYNFLMKSVPKMELGTKT